MADKTLVELTPAQHINRLIDETKINQYSTFKSALLGYFGYPQNSNLSLLALVQEFTGSNKTDPQACFNDAYGSDFLYQYTIREMLALGVGGLPNTNLIFDASVQSDGTFKDRLSGNLQTVYYPSLGVDYSWDGNTLTEINPNTAYNSYIGYSGVGAEVTFAGFGASETVFYYKYNTNTEIGETVETTTTLSGTLVVSLAQYEAISNLIVNGIRYQTLLYDGFVQILTATNCVQLFVPSVKVETFPATFPLTFEETSVDIFGQDIVDYLHLSGTIPPNAFISFDTLTVDVFDRENTNFFDPNNLFMNDYDSLKQRLFSVRNLVKPEKLRSVMYDWNIFSEKASDESLKRVVAYESFNSPVMKFDGATYIELENTITLGVGDYVEMRINLSEVEDLKYFLGATSNSGFSGFGYDSARGFIVYNGNETFDYVSYTAEDKFILLRILRNTSIDYDFYIDEEFLGTSTVNYSDGLPIKYVGARYAASIDRPFTGYIDSGIIFNISNKRYKLVSDGAGGWVTDVVEGTTECPAINGQIIGANLDPTSATGFHQRSDEGTPHALINGFSQGLYCRTSGTAYRPSTKAYGKVLDVIFEKKDASDTAFAPINSSTLSYPIGGSGYYLGAYSSEQLQFGSWNGNSLNVIYTTNISFIESSQNYRFLVWRNEEENQYIIGTKGTFGIYIQGRDGFPITDKNYDLPNLDEMELVKTATDDTYTTSAYQGLNLDAGDYIYELKTDEGTIDMREFVNDTGTYDYIEVAGQENQDGSLTGKSVFGTDIEYQPKINKSTFTNLKSYILNHNQKVLKSMKDNSTDVNFYELYANNNSVKFRSVDGLEANEGSLVKDIESISSNITLTASANYGVLLANNQVRFGALTEYSFGSAISGTVTLNGETVTLINNSKLTYADLQALSTPTNILESIKIS